MHAVIRTGGKQYRVKAGDELKIEKLDVHEGDQIVFEEILAVGDGDDIKIGRPVVEGATVTADVLEQGRLRKIVVFKK
ncbi:MAG: 50S ribosomal protein L21, partial [Myxococcota bacterium]